MHPRRAWRAEHVAARLTRHHRLGSLALGTLRHQDSGTNNTINSKSNNHALGVGLARIRQDETEKKKKKKGFELKNNSAEKKKKKRQFLATKNAKKN
jgi:hypothetical protein